jgi:hypothetical protein
MANVRIRDQGKLTLKDSDNSNEVSLQSPSTVSADQDFIVPNADGSANTIITTNASGTLSFTDINTLVTSDIDWQTGDIKTGNFVAASGKGYFVDTTGGAITATMPNPPSAGNIVAFKDYAGTFGTNNLTIDRNGHNIQGIPQDSIISTNRASVVLVYNADAVSGWLYTVENNVGDLRPPYVTATGGTITTSGDFKIHTFTSSGTFTVTSAGLSSGSTTVDYLVVAGGGGAGSAYGGGGGAGGFRQSFPNPATGGLPVSVQAYPITIGAGGAGTPTTGNKGSNSVFSTITSGGGGFGGTHGPPDENGGPGGSGGGSAGRFGPTTGGSGNTPPVSPPQGSNGGSCPPGTPGSPYKGAGGGGTSAVGENGGDGTPNTEGADGGNGSPTTISGSPATYGGGGGGGGQHYDPSPNFRSGNGGSGGGGPGGNVFSGGANPGVAGTANTGGGGGGGVYDSSQSPNQGGGGSGGSGVVVIRYKYQN